MAVTDSLMSLGVILLIVSRLLAANDTLHKKKHYMSASTLVEKRS